MLPEPAARGQLREPSPAPAGLRRVADEKVVGHRAGLQRGGERCAAGLGDVDERCSAGPVKRSWRQANPAASSGPVPAHADCSVPPRPLGSHPTNRGGSGDRAGRVRQAGGHRHLAPRTVRPAPERRCLDRLGLACDLRPRATPPSPTGPCRRSTGSTPAASPRFTGPRRTRPTGSRFPMRR